MRVFGGAVKNFDEQGNDGTKMSNCSLYKPCPMTRQVAAEIGATWNEHLHSGCGKHNPCVNAVLKKQV